MGRYIDWADVAGRYSQVNKLSGAEEVGSVYIQYAEAEVDARLAPCYTVPFSGGADAPVTVKDLAIDFTYLKAMFGKSKTWDKMNKAMDERIEKLCSGEMSVIAADGTALAMVGGTVFSTTEDYTPVFGMGDVRDFRVDPDRLDDEDAARD